MNATTAAIVFHESTECIWVQAFDISELTDNTMIKPTILDKVKIIRLFLDWNTNCNGLWNYRLEWFQWNSTQSFSLQQMKCVDSCSTGEVVIQSNYIHGLKVCRSLDYFIHPSSESILELGTRQNPYKNINLAFIELFNFVDASNLNITIRLSLGDAHVLVGSYF